MSALGEELIVQPAKAEEYKTLANAKFADGHYEEALALYTKAIGCDPNNAIYFSNRAFTHFKLENFGSCLQDANKAIEINPKYTKAYYRRASALFALGKLKDALRDFNAVVSIAPNDKDAKTKLKACQQEIKRIAFENAIASDEAKQPPKCETCDVSVIQVEDAYSGPRIPETGIDLEFCSKMMAYLKEQKSIHRKYATQIIVESYKVISKLPNVQEISLPASKKLTVCGDVHGQFYDLLNIFELNGTPSENNPYLFNGDFVDRGSFSVEVILTLLSFKAACPSSIFLSRGNHETLNMNKMYGFDGEVKAKYNDTILTMFREVFTCLPLACLIEKKVFVCHGGLFSKDGVTLDDIQKIDRHCEPPDEGIMTELLWSDPMATGKGRQASKRGIGVHFGADVTQKFLETNKLELLIRSHECKDEGYEVVHDGKCITIFSAPNYCDQMGNKGAFITFGEDMKPVFTTFSAVPHPDVKAMAYATSMPFF
eukprot:c13076_g1_i1.p1 GENE.c13076_g1_i1~~c13076_g1_i1.p1  ORF type:complete len:485 (-),score=188.02 c13076_g1_i1:64-1518(-)